MLTSAEIAPSRVEAEDARKRETRIAYYQREIDNALGSISKAKETGQESATLSFSCGHGHDEAERVREALIQLGYTCSQIEGRNGDWKNGVGHHRYLALEVQLNQRAH